LVQEIAIRIKEVDIYSDEQGFAIPEIPDSPSKRKSLIGIFIPGPIHHNDITEFLGAENPAGTHSPAQY
jgi:hypothetical protein